MCLPLAPCPHFRHPVLQETFCYQVLQKMVWQHPIKLEIQLLALILAALFGVQDRSEVRIVDGKDTKNSAKRWHDNVKRLIRKLKDNAKKIWMKFSIVFGPKDCGFSTSWNMFSVTLMEEEIFDGMISSFMKVWPHVSLTYGHHLEMLRLLVRKSKIGQLNTLLALSPVKQEL